MAKLRSFNTERLAVGFEDEFCSLKQLNFPSEAVEEFKLWDKVVFTTENNLAPDCVGFGTETGIEVEGPSTWRGRRVSIWVENEGNLL